MKAPTFNIDVNVTTLLMLGVGAYVLYKTWSVLKDISLPGANLPWPSVPLGDDTKYGVTGQGNLWDIFAGGIQ